MSGTICIKGHGFRSNGGGFSSIIVNGVRYTPEQIVNALIVASEVSLLGAGKCVLSKKLVELARAARTTLAQPPAEGDVKC